MIVEVRSTCRRCGQEFVAFSSENPDWKSVELAMLQETCQVCMQVILGEFWE